MSYPLVVIHNSTNLTVKGKVSYVSSSCSTDDYTATPMSDWKAKSRGVCLLTKVTATIYNTDGTTVDAASYVSSDGTTYWEFGVIKIGPDKYSVTRIVT